MIPEMESEVVHFLPNDKREFQDQIIGCKHFPIAAG